MDEQMPMRTRDDLVATLTETQAADDERWEDVVMELVDELAHLDVARLTNQASADHDESDFEKMFTEADRTRARLHNESAETVADWLIERIGVEETFAELDRDD